LKPCLLNHEEQTSTQSLGNGPKGPGDYVPVLSLVKNITAP